MAEAGESIERLLGIMRRLRAPDGCPWDREQTHASLKSDLIEEAYEVIDAIESGDVSHLEEELGDLLLQVVFHSQIAPGSNNSIKMPSSQIGFSTNWAA